MKYSKVIAIISISILALIFSSSHSAFDYDGAWKKVEQFMEKGLPKSALEEVKNIYVHAIKDNNIPQQIKAVTFKTQLILNTEELGLETVVSEMEESLAMAKTPSKQILHGLAGEFRITRRVFGVIRPSISSEETAKPFSSRIGTGTGVAPVNSIIER